MGEEATFIGYGMIPKNPYRNTRELERLGWFCSYDEEEDAECKPIAKATEICGEIGFHEPYESSIVFLGFIQDEDDEEGLPYIPPEKKAEVKTMYESLSPELKELIAPPKWHFIAHYV